MRARLRAIFALSAAAAACACAQAGSESRPAERPGAEHAAGATANSSAAPPAAAQSVYAPAAPEPYAPPFPSRECGDAAFEPFIRMSDGRAFESRELAPRPARKDLKLGANYPVLVGDAGRGAREFNRLALAFVTGELRPFLRDRSDADRDRLKGVEMEHHVSHTVVYASDELVSVLFYVTGYSTPAAHGYHFPVTLNFDLKAGRELGLGDIFEPGSGYLRKVAGLCAEEMKRQFGQTYAVSEGSIFADGLKPRAKNFDSWVVTRDGLVFIFEEYQLVAYSEGEPKVLIPFGRLKELMRPGGALAALAADAK